MVRSDLLARLPPTDIFRTMDLSQLVDDKVRTSIKPTHVNTGERVHATRQSIINQKNVHPGRKLPS